MQEKPSSIGRFLIIFFLGIIALVLLAGFMLFDGIRGLFAPIDTAYQGMSTQVSQLLNPTPTIMPDPTTIVHEVRSLARLETIQYNMEKVITAEQNQGLFGALIGDKLLFVAHGYVIAGVDLSELKTDDLWLTGETLHVRLPHAQVFVATLDNEKSYIYDRSLGILTKGNPTLESAARLAAEQEMRKAAEDDGILDQAQTNAEAYISSLLTQLGYPRIVFEDPTAP